MLWYDDRNKRRGDRRGKFLKDDQHAKGVQDYLADAFLAAHARKRKGAYKPRQIARNFFT